MFVRMKIGAYAGEIREVAFLAGKQLVDAGRAIKIDLSCPSAESSPVPPAVIPHAAAVRDTADPPAITDAKKMKRAKARNARA